jgi:L-fuculose-phosphate aldolase
MMATRNSMQHPRDEIMQTMERIYRYRMTTTSGGNLSIRDGDSIWITPARIDKGNLTRNDIVCVKANGDVVGPHPPSSEFPFHQAIYNVRPDVHGIVHAHPVALVAFSICKQSPNTRLFHQSRHVCGEVGFVPYAIPGSEQLGQEIAQCIQQGYNCAIMENHGAVIAGPSLQHAFQQFETLEFTAKTIIKGNLLGDVHYLSDEQIELPYSAIPPLPEFTAPQAGSDEKELRAQLCNFVQRGYRQRLLISTEGSFSARIDQDRFLITPYQVDRQNIAPEDIVLIHRGRAEQGKTPSRATLNHEAIYQKNPAIKSIVNAYPVNATAFGVTGQAVDSRTIPESYLFLRDVTFIPYGMPYTNREQLSTSISLQQPILVLQNDGVIVAGESILDAFDRLEVLESTAEAIINARALGDVATMPDRIIEELRAVFIHE